MKKNTFLIASIMMIAIMTSVISGAKPVEDFLRDLPPGVLVESSDAVPDGQTRAIEQKLGGRIARLTNSTLRVHGRRIQVNAVTAIDEAQAEAIHATLSGFKKYPFCFRNGNVVIEYVGRDIDEAIALKTSWELGLRPKPGKVRYLVSAKLATVEKMDYMASNPLFNQLLAAQREAAGNPARQISDLSSRFVFGRTLALRDPGLGAYPAVFEFEPGAASEAGSGPRIEYSFDAVPRRFDIPYVTVTMDFTLGDSGIYESGPPDSDLTAATPFWPVDDPSISALAEEITSGTGTGEAKVAAILEWLTPGVNLKYSGQIGSRGGTLKALGQGFGRCWDFSDVFVTLARAAGVPCRQVAGWMYGGSGHVWVEYYREGKGWQHVDPTGGGELKCGIYHIPYFTTEDGKMPILYVSMPEISIVE